jgi:hypothetical protein
MAELGAERALYGGLGFGPWDSFQAGKAVMIMLKTGEQVSITIKRPRKEGADILAHGSIPDPIDWLAD